MYFLSLQEVTVRMQTESFLLFILGGLLFVLTSQRLFRMKHEEASVSELVRGLYESAVETEASLGLSVTKETRTE